MKNSDLIRQRFSMCFTCFDKKCYDLIWSLHQWNMNNAHKIIFKSSWTVHKMVPLRHPCVTHIPPDQ